MKAAKHNSSVSIQRSPANNTQSATYSTNRGKSTRNSEDTHGKLNLEEQDRSSLPGDGPELDALFAIVVEDLSLFENFLLVERVGNVVGGVWCDCVVVNIDVLFVGRHGGLVMATATSQDTGLSKDRMKTYLAIS
jgi:hypothetical protein